MITGERCQEGVAADRAGRCVLPDGRDLAWSEYGDPDGRPVVAFHGTPSSRLDFAPLDAAARRLGVRIIAPDRPGHGDSSPSPGRRLVDTGDDVAALADHLGLERFALLGFSGGGPYAFATAARLGDRVSAVVGASAAGPVDGSGAMAGMSTTDRMFTWVSLRAPVVGRAWMRGMALVSRWAPDLAVRGLAVEQGPNAMAVLATLGSPHEVLAGFLAAVRQGPRWALEDYALVSRPWGVDLASITGPVALFHGSADRVVPLRQARDLARSIPTATLTEVSGIGHLLLHARTDEILQAIPT